MFCEHPTQPDWQRAHNELTRLAKTRAMNDAEEARWLLVAARARPDRRLGFASLTEYLERLFGWSPRLAREKLRVAEALEALPQIASALATGTIHWSCARELTRVAVAGTEFAWLEAVRGASTREIEELVSGHAPGDLPGDPRDAKLEQHTIHARVSAETMALWREAISAVRKASDGSLSEDEIIQTIARATLGGPKDDGRASYQIVLTKCEDCARTTQRGCGKEIVVDRAVLEAAECDAQKIDLDAAAAPGQRVAQEIPPATRRFVLHRDHHRCVVPGCRNATFVDVHHLHARSKGGDHHPDRLVTLCGAHHKQVHDGRLIIEGDRKTGLTFRHADQTHYGTPTNPTHADARSALRNLGFNATESERALATAAAHVGHANFETLLRAALLYLRTGSLDHHAKIGPREDELARRTAV